MSSTDFSNWRRAQDVIAQGALTNSKHPHSHVFGVYPTHCDSGNGSLLFAEGRPYVDYICSLGAIFFGHANPKIVEAVIKAVPDGFVHSLSSVYELDAAEALNQLFYFVSHWKFLKTGSAACSASIKIARAYTGKKLVLSHGYHGHDDEFVSLTSPATGVHTCKEIKTLESIDDVTEEVAGVIIEAVLTDESNGRKAWLQELRDKCTKTGTVLIFDEVITSFRFPNYCVAQYYNIIPDLIVIGKAMAGGLALSAVGGKKDIMNCDYFISTTFAGETLSLAACKAVCELLAGSHKYDMTRLWDEGRRFIDKFNEMCSPHIEIEGYPTRGVFKGLPYTKAILFQEACKAGILLGPSWFYNFGLIDHNHFFFTFLKDFMDRLKRGELKLEGELPRSPFAQRVRDGKG